MPSINENVVNADVRRGVLLRRLENQIANELISNFGNLETTIITQLLKSGETLNARELASLLKSLREVQQEFYKAFNNELLDNLKTIMSEESEYAASILNKLGAAVAVVELEAVRRAVEALPIQVGRNKSGVLLKDMLSTFSENQIAALNGIIRNGYLRGETLASMIKAIRGTSTRNFKDGLIEVSKRDAKAITRTAVNHVSNATKLRIWEESGVVTGWKFLAVLDSRTSQVCRAVSSLDRVYSLDDTRNLPPLHIQCRSQTTPVLKNEFAQLSEDATQSSEFGPVDADMTYYTWLKTQPSSYINNVLGPTWGKLFNKGRIDAQQFAQLQLNNRFQPITLEEFKRMHGEDFAEIFG